MYRNHHNQLAEDWWERRSFLAKWWRIQEDDSYWVPPYYPTIRRALEPKDNAHLTRLSPLYIHTEAIRNRKDATLSLETPVASAVALADPRRQDGVAYLALLHCANDAYSLERLISYLAELLPARGYHKVIGPTGLSPHLGSGLLQDYWNHLPPLHTPYHSPYMPEVVGSLFRPFRRSQLYHFEIPSRLPPPPPKQAVLIPLDPKRLAADLLPLFRAACPNWADFVAPDTAEAAFLLNWIKPWPVTAWLAEIEAQPVGFILLQSDLAPRLHRARGGRNLLWRSWLAWVGRRPAQQGRILFAAVLPDWQKQGIGRQLWHQALLTAHHQGWQNLTIGPLPSTAPANKFLRNRGAEPRQTYLLYQRDL